MLGKNWTIVMIIIKFKSLVFEFKLIFYACIEKLYFGICRDSDIILTHSSVKYPACLQLLQGLGIQNQKCYYLLWLLGIFNLL